MGGLEPAKSRMVAACPRCRARYRVLAERLPRQGARIRCVQCRAGFRVRLPEVARSARRSAPRGTDAALTARGPRSSSSPEGLDVPRGFPVARPPARPAEAETGGDSEAAQRLARIVASELVLYHPERFDAGIEAGDVLAAMASEIEEGRALLVERMGAQEGARELLEREILRVAAERRPKPAD